MAQVALGEDLNTLERGGETLQRHFEVIFGMLLRGLLAPFPCWRYVKLPADRALATAGQAIKTMIERARESSYKILRAPMHPRR